MSTHSSCWPCFRLRVTDPIETIHVETLDGLDEFLEDSRQRSTDPYSDCRALHENRAAFARLPIELSDRLVSKAGGLDLSHIAEIRTELSQGLHHSARHPDSTQIYLGLSHLESSLSVREKIEALAPPLHPVGDAIVRATLHLSPQTKIGVRELRRVVVSALLARLRQGPTGTCFATSVCLNALTDSRDLALQDFIDLLKTGKLIREYKGETEQFPALLNSAADGLSKFGCSLQLAGEAHACPIWQTIATVSGQALAKLQEQISSHQETRLIDHEIRHLVEEHSDPESVNKLYHTTRLAYQSYFVHPLIRVWEQCVAHMAEGFGRGHMEGQLFTWWSQFLNICRIRPRKQQSMEHSLNQETRYLYHPAQTLNPPEDSKRHQGAFVLYNTKGLEDSSEWVPVDTLEKFQKLVADHFKRAEAYNWRIGETLKDQRFIRDTREDGDPKSTLWVHYRGADEGVVAEAYFPFLTVAPSEEFRVETAAELFCRTIEIISHLPESQKQHYRERSNSTVLASTSTHAFTLQIGHPRVVAAWESRLDPKAWLSFHVINPCAKIWESPLPKISFDKWIRHLMNANIACENQDKFREAIQQIDLSQNLRLVYQAVIQALRQHGAGSKLDQDLAGQLYASLSSEQQNLLKEASVPLIDTNYAGDKRNVHIAFMANPGTGKVELWKFKRDYLAVPVDKDKWLGSQVKWELTQTHEGPGLRASRLLV